MRHEDGVRGDGVTVDAARLGGAHQALHHLADVVDVEPGAVERAVRGGRCEHLRDRLEAALPRDTVGLDHDRGRAHADHHAVPTPVERGRHLGHDVLGRGRAGGEEAGADPLEQDVAGDVVGGDDDHAPAPPGADPVLGQRHGLRGARARGVDLGVGPAGADQLGELRVTHRQAAEDEAAVVGERLVLQHVPQLGDPPVDLGGGRLRAGHPSAHGLQGEQLLAAAAVGHVPLDVGGELAVARERGGEDDAGVVAHGLRQAPPVREHRAQGGRSVAHHQRDARVAQGVDAGADRQAGGAVQGRVARGLDAEFLDHVQRRTAAGQLDDAGLVVDRLEDGILPGLLDQAGDPLVDHRRAEPLRDQVDELLAAQDPADVLVVEHPLDAGQPEGGAGDGDRGGAHGTRRRRRAGPGGGRCRRAAGVQLHAAIEHVGEHAAQFLVARGGHGGPRSRGRTGGGGGRRGGRDRRGDSGARGRRGGGDGGGGCHGLGGDGLGGDRSARVDRRPQAQPGRVQAAQRLVERHDVAGLRMVGEQREDVVVLGAEHLLDEAVQGFLGPDLDEHAGARVVQRAQALDELHRLGDLPAEDLQHRLGVGVLGIELPGHVRDDRQLRPAHFEAAHRDLQRLARAGHDLGVEGV